MTIWQGTFFMQVFRMKFCATGMPIDITDWEFHAQFRREPDEELLLDLSSADGEFVIHDAVGGVFSMQMQSDDTSLLPADETVKFDVMKIAPAPGPSLLFGGRVPVKQPVTHD